MTDSLHQRTTRLVKPVDPSIAVVLRAVDGAARRLGYQYFLAGATARDLVLTNALGMRPGRATRDIDFGLVLGNWDQFRAFKATLVAGAKFHADSAAAQRLYYRDDSAGWELPVDLIPFGPIASADSMIAWPPGGDVVLSVAGFDEALRSSLLLQVEQDLLVRAASLPGLAMLKLLAWRDRHLESNKDASDLYSLIRTYADAGNLDRLYGSELDLLETTAFDMELAGAQLLGRDIGHICDKDCLRRIQEILNSERLLAGLALQMSRVHDPFAGQPNRIETLLDYLRRGINEDKRRAKR